MRPPPPAWKPVLRGEARRQALAAITDIARALRDLPATTASRTSEQAGAQFGLFSGRAGIALFFGYLAKAGLFDEALGLAHRYLLESENALAQHGLDWSLCSGVVGIAWAHAHLRQSVFGEPDRGALTTVDDAMVRWLHDSPSTDRFDLLYGLVGLGVYGLERWPRRRAKTIVRLVVERLAAGTSEIDGLPGWADPPSGRIWLSTGEFNLGVAHGTPGVVAFLGRAMAAGVAAPSTVAMLRHATRWLLARRLPRGRSTFPTYCALDGSPGPPARLAWCYGDPGISAALWAAAGALGERGLGAEALRLARRASLRPAAPNGVRDASFCHGAAGLAQIYCRLARSSGDPRLRAAATRWLRRTLAFRRPGHGIGGYLFLPSRTATIRSAISTPGLLSGSAGVGLALLTGVSEIEPAWDRVFLLDMLRRRADSTR